MRREVFTEKSHNNGNRYTYVLNFCFWNAQKNLFDQEQFAKVGCVERRLVIGNLVIFVYTFIRIKKESDLYLK